MKIHYINILLFAFTLNILEHNQRNHNSTTYHTTKPKRTITHRSLCECDLYMPNYENDPQMKKVIQQFEDHTSKRFHEYDERMKTIRQKCREQCDKEIQKIILKDKLEKELTEKFATLQTDIHSDAIPTCICEKSMADKVEKTCLKCTQNLGGIVAPFSAIFGEIAVFAVKAWKTEAIAAATKAAMIKGTAQGAIAGNAHGMKIVISFLKQWGIEDYCREIFNSFVSTNRYAEVANISGDIIAKHSAMCADTLGNGDTMCKAFGLRLGTHASNLKTPYSTEYIVKGKIKGLLYKATQGAEAEAADVSSKIATELTAQETNVINTTYMSYEITIIASIIAVVVIVLIMVIIYLILRYRRKKKMKKKLQYIKLLEE
ncbi:PIR protein, putative [Plasmodium sp.]|nr:PIR protein, putative [Plasmodium sp.]